MIVYDQAKKIFTSTLITDNNFISGFGTKFLKDSRHVENIFNAFHKLEISYKTIVIPDQIHSVNVAIYNRKNQEQIEKIADTDGIITKDNETLLIVRTGDCVPVIFCDKKKGIIGISHQGWRGSLKKMVQKMITKMQKLGSRKENIFASIGPSIGACCYHIDDDRYYTFLSELDGYSKKIFFLCFGKRYLNLPLLNYLLLTEAGVPEKNIDFFPFCTKCDKERFFSFRRDKKNDYGEMMSFIMKRTNITI